MDAPAPLLLDVLYLVFDNGYEKDASPALAVCRASWKDERLLRGAANRVYEVFTQRPPSLQRRTRLDHACAVRDLPRVAELCAFASSSVATTALFGSVITKPLIKVDLSIIRRLIGVPGIAVTSGLDYVANILGARARTSPNLRAAFRELCRHPSAAPATALRAGIAASLPDVVRDHLDAGMAQWRREDEGVADDAAFRVCIWDFISRVMQAYLDSYRTPSESPSGETVVGAKLFFSHPFFSVVDAATAAGLMNDAAWLRELLPMETLVNIVMEGGAPTVNTLFQAACAAGADDVVRLLYMGGADANSVSPLGVEELLPYCAYAAALRGHAGIVEFIASTPESDVNELLIAACAVGDLDSVRLLVKRGADVNTSHRVSPTPLIAACEGGPVAQANDLLEESAVMTGVWENEHDGPYSPVAATILASLPPDLCVAVLDLISPIDSEVETTLEQYAAIFSDPPMILLLRAALGL